MLVDFLSVIINSALAAFCLHTGWRLFKGITVVDKVWLIGIILFILGVIHDILMIFEVIDLHPMAIIVDFITSIFIVFYIVGYLYNFYARRQRKG